MQLEEHLSPHFQERKKVGYFHFDFPQPVNVPITYMQQGSCLDHWAFPLIELMMGLGAMEPFGLGHVVNERFALEVRKVHGRQSSVE